MNPRAKWSGLGFGRGLPFITRLHVWTCLASRTTSSYKRLRLFLLVQGGWSICGIPFALEGFQVKRKLVGQQQTEKAKALAFRPGLCFCRRWVRQATYRHSIRRWVANGFQLEFTSTSRPYPIDHIICLTRKMNYSWGWCRQQTCGPICGNC